MTGSAVELPFLANVFDGIWCIGVLHHLDDGQAQQTILEMLRVCKPGGYVLILDAVLPRNSLTRPVAALIRRMDRGKNMRSQEHLVSLLPTSRPWQTNRFSYAFTGLEMLDCLCRKG